MPTNLTDRLGELVDKVTQGPCRTEIDNVFAGPLDNSVYVADCAPMGGPVDGLPEQIANAEFIALCFTHKDEILSALRKAEQPVSGDYAELVGRLRAPDLWAAVSSSGGQFIDGAPVEAATAIERLTAREAELREALRPFAKADTISARPDSWDINDSVAATKITFGDLRRARLSLGDEK